MTVYKAPIPQTPAKINEADTAKILDESLKTIPEVAKAVPDGGTPAAKTVTASKQTEVVTSAVEGEIDISTLTEEQAMLLDSIVARPLGFGNALDIKVKHPEYSYRWVNKQEQRQATMRALGFQLATLDDVDIPHTDSFRDGAIQMGDVVLMKMQKATYFAALKNNLKKAIIMGSKEGLDKAGNAEGEKAIGSLRGDQTAIRSKVAMYNPPIGELGGK